MASSGLPAGVETVSAAPLRCGPTWAGGGMAGRASAVGAGAGAAASRAKLGAGGGAFSSTRTASPIRLSISSMGSTAALGAAGSPAGRLPSPNTGAVTNRSASAAGRGADGTETGTGLPGRCSVDRAFGAGATGTGGGNRTGVGGGVTDLDSAAGAREELAGVGRT